MTTNIEAWADYARDRFEAVSRRVDEFRDWARQLGTAIAVVIGLEFSLVGWSLDIATTSDRGLRNGCLIAAAAALAIQTGLLFKLLRIGYISRDIIGPESPAVLARYVLIQDEKETRRVIGAYYAKAHDRFHRLSETLGRSLGSATRTFAWSIALFLVGIGLLLAGAIRSL